MNPDAGRSLPPTPVELRPPPPGSGVMPAVCHRCGADKKGPFVPCKTCGYVPTGQARQVAWLFSGHHLDEVELVEAARRVAEGEVPEPSRALLEAARVAMGALPLDHEARRLLTGRQLGLLVLGNVVFTPLAGLAIWWGIRATRPPAARQVLLSTVPVMGVFAVCWLAVIWHSRGLSLAILGG